MAYQFEKRIAGAFKIYKSTPSIGTVHLKRFINEGITPESQETLNIYAEGKFSLEINGLVYTFTACTTSLDWPFGAFPSNMICTETALSENCVRYCIAPVEKVSWQKVKLNVLKLELSIGELAIVKGEIIEGPFELEFSELTSVVKVNLL